MKNEELSKDELLAKVEKLELELDNYKSISKRSLKAEEHNNFLSSLLNAVEQSVIVTKPHGEVIYWNPYAEKLYGWSAEQAIGQNILELTVPQVSEEQGVEIMEKLNAGHSWSGEFCTQHKNGKTFPAFVTDTPIYNENKELVAIIGVSIDISTRKQAEAAFIESKEKFKSFFDSDPSAIFVWKAIKDDFILTEANKMVFNMTENRVSQFIGLKATEIYSDLPIMIEKLNECYSKKETIDFECHYKNRYKGTFDWIEFTLVFSEPDVLLLYSDIINERKQAEQNLKESEERLNLVIKGSNDAHWDWDFVNKTLYYSPQWWAQIGYKPNELQVHDHLWYELTHQDDRAQIDATLDKALKTDMESYHLEFRLKHKKGHYVPVLSRGFIIRNSDGGILRIAGTNMDLTERKLSEKALFESEHRFRLMFENHNAVMLLIEPKNGMIVNSNHSASKFYGYSKNELNSMRIEDINTSTPEDIKKDRMHAIDKLANTFVFKHRLKTGELRDVQVHSTPIEYKNQKLLFSIIFDITKRKQAEVALLQNQKRYKKAQEMGHVGNWEYCPHQGLFWGSDEAKRIYGFELGSRDFTSEKVESCIPERERVHQALMDLIANNEKYDLVFDILTYDEGIRKTIHSIAELEKDAQDNIIKISGVIIDITESKKAELELQKAKEKAEESDRLKSAFLANMSHEIRTPMNGILGFTDLLKEPDISGEEQKKFIEIIERNGSRMLTTINDIIDISKIESGHIDIIISDIDLNKRLDELFEFFLPEAEKKNLKFKLTKSLCDQLVIIKSDREKIDSILTNLIKNAIKYTKSGHVEFGYTQNKMVSQVEFKFYIKDSGIGIPRERLSAVFNRFIQADIEDNYVYEGSGLGLAISKAYVEMLGGQIWLESVVGVGSQFYFTIPIDKTGVVFST